MQLAELAYDKARHDDALRSIIDKKPTATQAVFDLVKLYGVLYDANAYQINCGMCEDFAHDLVFALGEDPYSHSCPIEIRWHDEMEDCTKAEADQWSHCFVAYKGRYYDSQVPWGVKTWRELPCFRDNPIL